MSLTQATPEEPFTRLQIRTIAFCFVFNMLNGAGVLAISYAAPLLTRQWDVGDQALGIVFSAGLAGMVLGGLALAPLSDVFGRKAMILVATVMIATGMAATSTAANVEALIGLRVWVGLGVGSMLASVTSMAAEFAPNRHRSLAVTIATSGYPVGAIATGLAANALLPASGWPSLFLAAAALSALMFPLCLRLMPESIEFLLVRQPPSALARVNRILKVAGGSVIAALPEKSAVERPSPRLLLTTEYRRQTVLVWVAFFASFVTLYFLVSWIPTIAVDAGLPIERAIFAGAAYHTGSLTGRLFVGALSSRFSLTALIAGCFAFAALLMALAGAMHEPAGFFLVEIFAIGLFAQGGFSGLYAAAARIYPTAFRATGIGWALGTGRMGAVLGPYFGGLIIAAGVSVFGSFLIFAVPMLVAGGAVAVLGGHHLGRVRTEASPPVVG